MVPKNGVLGEEPRLAWSVFRAAAVDEIFSSRSGACRGGGIAFAAREGGSFGARLAIDGAPIIGGEQLGISVRHGGGAAASGIDALPAPRERAGNDPIAILSTEVLASCFINVGRRSFAALLPFFSA
jgi:hypothetical protein